MYDTVTLEQVINRAKDMCRIDNTDDDANFYIWAEEAVRELDTLSFYVKDQCKVEIHDGKAALPKGMTKLLAVWFDDCRGMPYYVNTKYLTLCGCEARYGNQLLPTMQINRGHFIFQNLPSTQAYDPDTGLLLPNVYIYPTVANIAYMSYNLDENGVPVIYQTYERAVWNYCCAMYKQMMGQDFSINLRQWIASKNKIVSGDQQAQFQLTKRQVAQWYNAWVVDMTKFL